MGQKETGRRGPALAVVQNTSPHRRSEAPACDGTQRPRARCAWCRYCGEVRFESQQHPTLYPRGRFPLCLVRTGGRAPDSGRREVLVVYPYLHVGPSNAKEFTGAALQKAVALLPEYAVWPLDKNPDGSCADYTPSLLTRLLPWRK